jgi:import inner membrane translocase subunit TIM23
MSNSNLGTGKGGDNDHIETGAPLPNFNTNIQLSTIAPAYGIQSQQQPDYLDYDQKGRGVVSTMFTNSGISYLGGVIVGGMYGLQEGLRNTPSSRWKVKLNSVLNHCGRYGSQVGNMMGATAILYSLYEGVADTVSRWCMIVSSLRNVLMCT